LHFVKTLLFFLTFEGGRRHGFFSLFFCSFLKGERGHDFFHFFLLLNWGSGCEFYFFIFCYFFYFLKGGRGA
jgi:hypothetical protein